MGGYSMPKSITLSLLDLNKEKNNEKLITKK